MKVNRGEAESGGRKRRRLVVTFLFLHFILVLKMLMHAVNGIVILVMKENGPLW